MAVSDYERYLCLDALLSCQTPEVDRVHPDELQFQVVHHTLGRLRRSVRSRLPR